MKNKFRKTLFLLGCIAALVSVIPQPQNLSSYHRIAASESDTTTLEDGSCPILYQDDFPYNN